jgi:hypothetical protein
MPLEMTRNTAGTRVPRRQANAAHPRVSSEIQTYSQGRQDQEACSRVASKAA